MFVFRFDLYFRRNPFGGEYTVFAGLEECIRFIANFTLAEEEIDFVRECLSSSCEVKLNCDPLLQLQLTTSSFCFMVVVSLLI